MSANNLQALLRFLTQDAKIPLGTALRSVPALQEASLPSIEAIASQPNPSLLEPIFTAEKQAKQILSAAKRITKNKKRSLPTQGNDTSTSPNKKPKKTSSSDPFALSSPTSTLDQEESLLLPSSLLPPPSLAELSITTNRAPLVLAFLVVLLKHTLPSQPLSSRLSLAQGYIGLTARARAISLGIESGKTAEEEGWGEGQPRVRILGKQVCVLKRYGVSEANGEAGREKEEEDDEPALWALDLEALKSSNSNSNNQGCKAKSRNAEQGHLPIHTPQSARNYLLKAFTFSSSTSTETETETAKPKAKSKTSLAIQQKQQKEEALGVVLRSIELVYDSWSPVLSPSELDARTWGWYVRVRPAVAEGKAGWGGRGEVRIKEILELMRKE